MRNLRIAMFTLLALTFSAPFIRAQGTAPATREESSAALQVLMQEILQAQKAGDTAALEKLFAGLILPDYEAWLLTLCGDEMGYRVAAAYGEKRAQFPAMLSSAFDKLLADGFTEIEILTSDEPFLRLPGEGTGPTVIISKQRPTRLYVARFWSADRKSKEELWYLAYVNGDFRYLGTLKPTPLDACGPDQITMSSLVMLTPTEDIDFTPYLDRLSAVVRRNWYAQIPESAKKGERGCVVVQFRILQNGQLAAMPVLQKTSKSVSLDRASLAAVRTAAPFDALPSAFQGSHIELRFIFLYNIVLPPAPPPPPAAPPKRLRMGGNVMKGKLVIMVEPKYPPLAAQAGIAGTVRLQIIVAKDGTVSQVEVLSGHPLLVQAALDAVKQWQYQPTLLNGEPVEVVTTVDVSFSLDKKPPKEN